MLNKAFVDYFLKAVSDHQQINIFCHINPDYDTLGSGYGLKDFLVTNYPDKHIQIVNTASITNIQDSRLFHFDLALTNPNDFAGSLGIVVDVAQKDRIMGGEYLDLVDQLIIIDHHLLDPSLHENNWIESEYPACCQQIAELIRYLYEERGMKITPTALTYLYAGLLTDTNRFLYDCVMPSTYDIAGWLALNGAGKKLVHDELYLRNLADAKRRAKFLNMVKISDYGVGSLFIAKRYNKLYQMSGFHDAVSIMEGFHEIKIWISCYYNEDFKTWNCSLRSRDYPVVQVAQKYGGGGHRLAAGCRIQHPSDFTKIIEDLNQLVIKYGPTNH